MHIFEVEELSREQARAKVAYLEFLRVPQMSLGIYHLRAGAKDPQKPHREDEAYYVVSGRGMIQVADEERAVEPGTVIFVPAQLEHRFHSITEDLMVLVMFAPAETAE